VYDLNFKNFKIYIKRDFSAPHWPYSMGFYLNGIERSDGSTGKAFIPPPQHGHVRKERPHIDLTKLPIAGSVNKLRLVCKYYTGNEPLEGGAEPRGFAFGLFWCFFIMIVLCINMFYYSLITLSTENYSSKNIACIKAN